MYRHLQDESYYSELYDRATIEGCKRWESLVSNYSPEEIQKMQKEKVDPKGVK